MKHIGIVEAHSFLYKTLLSMCSMFLLHLPQADVFQKNMLHFAACYNES